MGFTCKLCGETFKNQTSWQAHGRSAAHLRKVAAQVSIPSDASMTARPVVFSSDFEHNSNLLTWRETGADIVVIHMTSEGDFDYEALERELTAYDK